MSNVGLGITFVQRAREINQLAVQFGCIVVVAQPLNPKLCNNLDDFAFSSPSALWLNRTNYSGLCGSMQRKPRFMQVNTLNFKSSQQELQTWTDWYGILKLRLLNSRKIFTESLGRNLLLYLPLAKFPVLLL